MEYRIPEHPSQAGSIRQVFFIQSGKKAAVVFDTIWCDFSQNDIFCDTFYCCFRVIHAVPAAAVQQAVRSPGSAGTDFPSLVNRYRKTSFSKVIGYCAASEACTNNYRMWFRTIIHQFWVFLNPILSSQKFWKWLFSSIYIDNCGLPHSSPAAILCLFSS